jgi:hypothetical protein
MSTAKTPDVRLRAIVQRDGDIEETWRMAKRGFADASFTEPRISYRGWGDITRALSDDQGQFQMATGGVSILDDGEEWREAIDENEVRFANQTEAIIETLSRSARKAGGATWRSLLRGRMSHPKMSIERSGLSRRRTVTHEIIDSLAPYLDQPFNPYRFLRTDFSDIHRDLENTPIPIVGGPHTDSGAVDQNGDIAEKGLVPALHVGTIKSVDNGVEFTSASGAFLTPPTISASVNGTPGTSILYYGMTKLTAVGETILGNIEQVTTAPATLTGVNSITLTGFADAQATGYVVYRGFYPNLSSRIAVLAAGVTSYTDTGVDTPRAPGPPNINRAQVTPEDGSFFWDFYVYAVGWVPMNALYASNNSPGTAAKRSFVPEYLTAGTDFSTPDSPNWPFPDPWITLPSGLRVSGFLGRGPRSLAAVEGTVTIAVNTCGPEEVGDGSGLPMDQAFPLFQWALTQFVPMDGGLPYQDGDWLAPREFANGDPILRTDKFTDCQNLTKIFLNGEVGYLGSFYVRDLRTVREFIQSFFRTFDAFGATDHFGSFYPVLWDVTQGIDEGQVYREKIEIIRVDPPEMDRTYIEPKIRFQYAFDPDAGRFRAQIEEAKDDDAIAAQPGQWRDRGVVNCDWTHDPDTVRHAQNSRCQRLKYPRWKQVIYVRPAPGFQEEPGNQIIVTHRDGFPRWIDQPFMIYQHRVDLNTMEVALTVYDKKDILEQAQENIMDETGAILDFIMT